MSERLQPLALYRAFRDSKVGKVANAVVPVLPMAPMPVEGFKDHTSRVAHEYKKQIRENNVYHAIGILAEAVLGAALGGIAIITGHQEAVVPLLLTTAGVTNAHGLRAFINEIRYQHHEERAKRARRKATRVALA